jgi:hypothetical protein
MVLVRGELTEVDEVDLDNPLIASASEDACPMTPSNISGKIVTMSIRKLGPSSL